MTLADHEERLTRNATASLAPRRHAAPSAGARTSLMRSAVSRPVGSEGSRCGGTAPSSRSPRRARRRRRSHPNRAPRQRYVADGRAHVLHRLGTLLETSALLARVRSVEQDPERVGELVDDGAMRQVRRQTIVHRECGVGGDVVEDRRAATALGCDGGQYVSWRRDHGSGPQRIDAHTDVATIVKIVIMRTRSPNRGNAVHRAQRQCRHGDRASSGTPRWCWYQYTDTTLVSEDDDTDRGDGRRRTDAHAAGTIICHRYQGRPSERRYSNSSPGRLIAVVTSPDTPPNGMRHVLRVGTPIRAPHHGEHRDEHEAERAEDRDQPDASVAAKCHPHAERHDHQGDVLLHEQRQHHEHGVRPPPSGQSAAQIAMPTKKPRNESGWKFSRFVHPIAGWAR